MDTAPREQTREQTRDQARERTPQQAPPPAPRPAPRQATPRTPPRTVRLAFLWRAAGAPVGSVLALAMGIALARSGTAARLGAVPALLLSATTVLAVALPVPYGFWLRADDNGLTLVRAFLPRRYRWQDIHSLAMETSEDPDSGAPRLVLLLRLTPTPRRATRTTRPHGPMLGALAVTADKLPCGTEPRPLAELFDLLRRHGVPLEDPRYAALVLTAHGFPPPLAVAGPTPGHTPAPASGPARPRGAARARTETAPREGTT